MTFSILVLYCWRFHSSSLKKLIKKVCQHQVRSIKHCYKSFQASAGMKRSKILQWLRARGHLKWDVLALVLGRPFLCTQAALGGSSTCSYTSLLASVVCNHCQKLPRRVLGQALSGNKKSPECGSWPHKCEDVQSPSRDSTFHITAWASCQEEILWV